jgi:hypothetical protein
MTRDERLAECEREISEAKDDWTTHDRTVREAANLRRAALSRATGWASKRDSILAEPPEWGDGIPINVMAEFMGSGERREGEG